MASVAHQFNFDQIPTELRRLPNWVCWRLEKRTNKSCKVYTTKVPYNPRTGKLAKPNDPATGSSFEEALAAFERGGYDGIGIVLTVPYVGVDLDGSRLNGTFEAEAERIIQELASYTELSPSRSGAHVVAKGELPDGRRQIEFEDREHHGVGLYDAARGRFLTMTGLVIRDCPIAERTAELCRIHARLFPPEAKAKGKAKSQPASDAFLSDEELIAKARGAKDGGKFWRLWDGKWQDDYPSQSEADLALCAKLAFWAGPDAERIDRLFRCSGLMRDKWERSDYRQGVIKKALAKQTEFYRPANRQVSVNLDALPLSLETLNALTIFGGKVRFQSIKSRGSMIVAAFTQEREAVWPSTRDLLNFSISQALIAEATGIVMPSPPRTSVRAVWEPAAQLILQLAGNDRVTSTDRLRDEFQQILYGTWKRAGCPSASTKEEFFRLLQECEIHKRDPRSEPPRCAIWHNDKDCYVHQPTLLDWLSTPVAKSKHYDWGEVQKALLLLEFKPQQLHRKYLEEHVNVRVWCGPLALLIDDETAAEGEEE